MTEAIDLSDRAPIRRVWLAAAGWSALGLLETLALRYQWNLYWVQAISNAVIDYTIMGLITWYVCGLSRRLELWKSRPVRALLVYTALIALSLATWWTLKVGVVRVLVGPSYWTIAFAQTWMFQILSGAFTLAAALGLGVTIHAFDREHERREQEARLEVVARDAELEAIKGHLRPHFLLNSLNSILALVDDDPSAARGMIVRLSSLLHAALDGLDEPLVPLDRELGLVRDYLEVERIRFGERLHYDVGSDGVGADLLVPPLLLHPLVENAVRHGIEPSPAAGTVRVSASRAGSRLTIRIANSLDAAYPGRPGTGRGLELTRRRLRSAYGGDGARFTTEHSGGDFVAVLDLPVREHVV